MKQSKATHTDKIISAKRKISLGKQDAQCNQISTIGTRQQKGAENTAFKQKLTTRQNLREGVGEEKGVLR